MKSHKQLKTHNWSIEYHKWYGIIFRRWGSQKYEVESSPMVIRKTDLELGFWNLDFGTCLPRVSNYATSW